VALLNRMGGTFSSRERQVRRRLRRGGCPNRANNIVLTGWRRPCRPRLGPRGPATPTLHCRTGQRYFSSVVLVTTRGSADPGDRMSGGGPHDHHGIAIDDATLGLHTRFTPSAPWAPASPPSWPGGRPSPLRQGRRPHLRAAACAESAMLSSSSASAASHRAETLRPHRPLGPRSS
jgi:hypothetical protein